MHSADPTIGCSVRQTPRGHEGANTAKWGMPNLFAGQLRPRQLPVRRAAESSEAGPRWRRSHYPAVTATGEGRS